MTDREKLVELIMRFRSYCGCITHNDKCTNCEVIDKLDCRKKQELFKETADVLESIANGVTFADCLEEKQATSDWISVEEMLPVPYVNVLVTRKSLFGNYRFVGIECITYNHGEARVWGNDHKGWKTEVTHWMLLPEPPKGETNDANL